MEKENCKVVKKCATTPNEKPHCELMLSWLHLAWLLVFINAMVDCASIHPSTLLQRACESLQKTHAWHQDIVPEDDTKIQQIGGSVCMYLGGWLSGVGSWEGSLLEGKHQASNKKRLVKMVEWLPALWLQSIPQSSSWLGESPPTAAHPSPSHCLAAWNWDRWLHSDRIIPNLVLIYTVHIIHFYNMTRKTSSRRDGLMPRFHASIDLGVGLIIPDMV